jgi:antibiotic biosynthesis monooxygenase
VVSRVNFLETAPDRIGDIARVVREVVHPGISSEAGYVGYIVLGDRESGKALGVTLWESEEAREAACKVRLPKAAEASAALTVEGRTARIRLPFAPFLRQLRQIPLRKRDSVWSSQQGRQDSNLQPPVLEPCGQEGDLQGKHRWRASATVSPRWSISMP